MTLQTSGVLSNTWKCYFFMNLCFFGINLRMPFKIGIALI